MEKKGQACCGEHYVNYRSEKVKSALTNRLSRIEGQVRGIKGMVDKDIYCDDILIQIASIQSAIKGVSKLLLETHMRTCIADKIKAGDEEAVDEVLKTIERMMK